MFQRRIKAAYLSASTQPIKSESQEDKNKPQTLRRNYLNQGRQDNEKTVFLLTALEFFSIKKTLVNYNVCVRVVKASRMVHPHKSR